MIRLVSLNIERSKHLELVIPFLQKQDADVASRHAAKNNAVSFCDFEKDGATFRIATTHFTWTPDGNPDEFQREDMKNMLAILSKLGDFVLCGDFNAPRGGEIFSMLAEKYKDNTPAKYTTSIDKDLHRAGDLQLMVDGLFSTPDYAVSDVELHSGVSDHLAITATVAKAESEQRS